MSRILKRPMFRKGGPAMEGVMKLASGGRAKYAEAGKVSIKDLLAQDPFGKEVYDLAQAAYGRDVQQERSDVLANLLIRGGLGLVSGKGATGNTLRDIAGAFQAPTETALKEMAALKQDPAAMLAAKAVIEQRGAERLKQIEYEGKLAADKKDRIETAQKQEGLRYNSAKKFVEFQDNSSKISQAQNLRIGDQDGIVIGVPKKGGKIDYVSSLKNRPAGIYYDPDNDTYIRYEAGDVVILSDPYKKYTPQNISIETQKKLAVPEYDIGANIDPDDPFSGGLVP